MRLHVISAFIVLLSFFLASSHVFAGKEKQQEQPLVIGTKLVAPFAMKTQSEEWTGISIDLWKRIADHLDLSYRFQETQTVAELINGVENGSFDAAVAALTITAKRESSLDFTHPYYSSGMGIAVNAQKGGPWFAVVKRFLSLAFLKVVASLSLVLIGVGCLVWWFERKQNPNQFGQGPVRGVGSGFWWSAVTMTTVGYGDKAPVTLAGRFVALIWMFVSIIVISGFTAAITSSLTVSQLGSVVQGPHDLIKVRVGSIADTTSGAYMAENHASFQSFQTVDKGLEALHQHRIDAFVYDAPVLQYMINQGFPSSLMVLPRTFEHQDYGIALPQKSLLREPINRILLKEIKGKAWDDILYRYLKG